MTAEFAVHSSLTGKCRYTHALIESDEAAFKAISRFVDAKAVVVTNVFRDQLDRYGEVTHTLDNIRIGICNNSKNAVLCVNADDSLCASLHDVLPNPVVFFGVDTPIYHEPGRGAVRRAVLHPLQARICLRLCDLRALGRLPLPELRLPPTHSRRCM